MTLTADKMALIEDRKGRKDGGYSRLFGNEKLGWLLSRIHATVISSGTELERLIKEHVPVIDDLDKFLKQEIMPDGVFLADKPQLKKCNRLDFAGSEPDFMIFKRREGQQKCHMVELKDGDTFDTKKAAAEHRTMHSFISKNARHLPFFKVSAHFCCFNQDNKQAIITGFKQKIDPGEALTGREFCKLLEIDYETLIQSRNKDCEKNFSYFLSELIKIKEVKNQLKTKF